MRRHDGSAPAVRPQPARHASARSHALQSSRDAHVVAALRLDGLTAPAVFDGPIDNPTCLAYVEHVLVPTLRAGDVVVLDNLAVHNQPGGGARPSKPSARRFASCRPPVRTSIRSSWLSRN